MVREELPKGMQDVAIDSFAVIDFTAYRFPIISVFEKPADYPDKYVARIYDIETPTNVVMVRDTVEEIIEDLDKTTDLVFLPRDNNDGPNVYGIWL